MPQLRHVNLSGCAAVSSNAAAPSAPLLPFTTNTLEVVLAKRSMLDVSSVGKLKSMKSPGLEASASSLRELDLSHSTCPNYLSGEGDYFSFLNSIVVNMRTLNLSHAGSKDLGFFHVAAGNDSVDPNVTFCLLELDISSSLVVDISGLILVANTLQKLNLRACKGITNFAPLKKLKRLEWADLSGTSIRDLAVLSPGEREPAILKSLRLTHCRNVCSTIPFATLWPCLENLDLSFVDEGALSLNFFALFKPHPVTLCTLHLFGLVAREWDSRGEKFVQIFQEKYGTVISGVGENVSKNQTSHNFKSCFSFKKLFLSDQNAQICFSQVDSVRESEKTALGREQAWNSMLIRQVTDITYSQNQKLILALVLFLNFSNVGLRAFPLRLLNF